MLKVFFKCGLRLTLFNLTDEQILQIRGKIKFGHNVSVKQSDGLIDIVTNNVAYTLLPTKKDE